MARKEEVKADAQIIVNVDDFTRTRDNVIVSLSQLQSAVSDLTRAYIQHANTVLNRGATDLTSLTSSLAQSPWDGALLPVHSAGSPGERSEAGGKKRKRAPHDPLAPKRALTPFFLYMHHNRAQIAEELGPKVRPKEVADEGARRWGEMADAQKEVWKKLYLDNLAAYKQKMAAYKAGHLIPEDDSSKAAAQIQQDAAAAESSDEVSDEDASEDSNDDSSDSDTSEPAKEPTPPRSSGKRRRSEVVKTSKEPNSPPVTKKELHEKRKRPTVSKKEKVDEVMVSIKKGPPPSTESKRSSKKKRKSESGPAE